LENLNGRDHLGDQGVDEMVNIKMDLTDIGCEDRNWIHPSQDRVQWWGLVNMVMKVQIA
jgi:hypothetical protein